MSELEKEIEKERATRLEKEGVSLGKFGAFDQEIFGTGDKYAGYSTTLSLNDDEEEQLDERISSLDSKRTSQQITAPRKYLDALEKEDQAINKGNDNDVLSQYQVPKIKENEYQKRRYNRLISPARHDPFAVGAQTPDVSSRTYSDIIKEQELDKEKNEIYKQIKEGKIQPKKQENKDEAAAASKGVATSSISSTPRVRKSRFDVGPSAGSDNKTSSWETPARATETSEGLGVGVTPSRKRRRWDDATPSVSMADRASSASSTTSGSWGGETPKVSNGNLTEQTPSRRKRRWDMATPQVNAMAGGDLDITAATPVGGNVMTMQTPTHLMTASASAGIGASQNMMSGMMTPDKVAMLREENELWVRNRPLSDEELDLIFPTEGYVIIKAPNSYVPLMTPTRKLMATPTPHANQQGFLLQEQTPRAAELGLQEIPETAGNLPSLKPEDVPYFDKLLKDVDEEELDPEQQKERKIMKLLLKIKNGTPPMRKSAMRTITDKARDFGAGPLFNQILPLLMTPTLEDQERHLLVKVIDRVLYKLDDLVRPYVHKILVVIEPLLIVEDYYARIEGREIISNLAKAAGLGTMIFNMRPDIDNEDEYVRNTTARAFAVVASALGIPQLLPFLKAVCKSKKSWQARHTGIKIVQQISILMGCAILPHLRNLVGIIAHGLEDEQQKVRTISALAIAALAEAATPYGIESFQEVIKQLHKGIEKYHGKGLAAFLKAIGYIIPLMSPELAVFFTGTIHKTLVREFQSPDPEMRKIVLKVLKQCCATDGVDAQFIREHLLSDFFTNFWVKQVAHDRLTNRQLVDTTVEIANKVGVSDIISRIVQGLKDDSEPFRKMVMETIEKVVGNLGAADIDADLEAKMIDGIISAFQEQDTGDFVMLNGFGTVANTLGSRIKPYLQQISAIILWRLNNKKAKVRQQAADLISRIAVVMKSCDEEVLMGHLGRVLFENIGEEYPEVLGSILGAMKSIVNVIGMSNMTPPIKDLLPRLTPILKNRHEKVQENCIDLVGRIADRGAEFVGAREWMRICFELLELLKAHKKAIRRAAVNTFGYIAKAIGPQDVLVTLLNNLKVQERQNRVCTTVAIAIVAETCSPFTVLPHLMNEYRVPELNVQNGVLKSLSFLFEYIGEMGKDYVYAVTPLLEDALIDRDLVHRQTACTVVKHMSLGIYGFGLEESGLHLLNHIWPNIFETSPHVITAVLEAIEGLRVCLGSGVILYYVLTGLFHPAKKVRSVYWKVYNSLYIGAQDSLVAFYPRLKDNNRNQYRRVELDYVL